MALTKRSYTDMLLGLFVAGAIALLVTFVFLLGQERRLFDSTKMLRAQFPNVAGLRVGADVLLGGVAVGRVSGIEFPPIRRAPPKNQEKDQELAKPMIMVSMRISSSMMPQIRQDSSVRIDSEGLLGDKVINISMGASDKEVHDGDLLMLTEANLDLNQRLAKVQTDFSTAISNVSKTADSANKVLENFTSKGGEKVLVQFIESMKNVANEIDHGDGIIHKLVYDKKAGADFQAGLASLEDTIASVKKTVGHLDGVLGELQNGKGLLHSLVYDPKGADVITNADSVLKEVESIARGIRNGSGILHSLIYDEDNGNLIRNMNAAAADLQNIVSRVKNGEGTFGRLIADPTVYEDLKLILSDVKRNKVLKTLVRFGISVNENPNE
jgi:phospholipid/cholesterol/gamma-HCH transport system substrate-binding protein